MSRKMKVVLFQRKMPLWWSLDNAILNMGRAPHVGAFDVYGGNFRNKFNSE